MVMLVVHQMTNLNLEIYEGDPFESSCCGPGKNNKNASTEIRAMLIERKQIVDALETKYKGLLIIKREILNYRNPVYPQYVSLAIFQNKNLPFIFLNKDLKMAGKFPNLTEFDDIIKKEIENT